MSDIQAMLLEKERMTAVLASIGDGVILTDINGKIEFMNYSAENITGWKADQTVGKDFNKVFKVFNIDTDELLANPVKKALETNNTIGLQNGSVISAKDGSIKYVSASCSPIKVPDIGITGVVVVFRDITRIMTLEKENIAERDNLKILFDSSPVGMFFLNEDAVISQANNAALILFDKKYDEIIGKSLGDAAGCLESFKDKRGCGYSRICRNCELKKAVTLAFETGKITENEECRKVFIREGKEVELWFRASFTPIAFKGNRNVVVILADITDSKRKEISAIEANKAFLKMMEDFPTMIWRTDKTNNCDYINKVWLDFTGLNSEEAVGKGWLKTFHTEDIEKCKKIINEAFEQRIPFEMEHRMERYDGEYRWVVSMGTPYYDLENNFAGLVGTVYDITERKMEQEGLKRYQVLSEKVRDIILFTEMDGRIIEANEAAVREYGYTRDELLAKTVFDLLDVDDVIPDQIDKADREGIFFEIMNKRKDGSTFPVEVSLQGANFGDRRLLVSITRDISERKIAEMAIRESEEKYRDLFENANDAIFVMELGDGGPGKFIEANDTACGFLGYSKEEFKSLSIRDISANDNYDQIYSEAMKTLIGKGNCTFETIAICKNRSLLPFEINAHIFHHNGRKKILSAARNITERKQAQKEIVESHERYQSLFMNMLNGFTYNEILFDDNGQPNDYRILEVNDAYEKITGAKRENIIGKSASKVFEGKQNPEWFSMCCRAAINEESFMLENWYSPILNKLFTVSIYSPQKDYFAIMLNDTTDDVKATMELQASKTKYQTLLMNMNAGFGYFKVICNETGIPVDCAYIEINKAFEDFTGVKNEELTGKSFLTESILSQKFMDKFREVIRSVSFEGGSYKIDEIYIDDLNKWCSTFAYSPERGYLAIILNDITAERNATEQLKKAKNEAEMANRAKSEFLANMSHEIRTPLNGVIGMIDITISSKLEEEQKENLCIAKSCANSLLILINDILDFSKMEAGKLIIENINFNIKQLIEDTIKFHSPLASEKRLELNYMFSSDIPEYVVGDPNRLQQVLNNLINNAIKFTASGNVTVTVKVNGYSGDKVEMIFSVVDTGIGIARNDMDRLFKSFSQVDGSQTRKFGGTGLGLAISKQLVELMGGNIWVESEKGIGSNFNFVIEFTIGKSGVNRYKEENNSLYISQNQFHILLVEDDKVNQTVLVRILKEKGHSVDTADNGIEALALHEKNEYDVILMDIQMPVMDGIETTQHIREKEGTGRHTPIIALTAYALQGDRERFLSKGMDDYISKPIDMDKLMNALENVSAKPTENDISIKGIRLGENGDVIFVEGNRNKLEGDKQNIISEISDIINQVIDILTESDLKAIEAVAGKIKALANQIEADDLKNSAFRIELAARRGDLKEAIKHVTQIKNEFETFKKTIS